MYQESRGAPEIGRRLLDLSIPHHPPRHGSAQLATLPPPYLDVPLYDEYYRTAIGPRLLSRPGSPVQHRLSKLDVFKGGNGERLDNFIYQVEEYAAFHAWDHAWEYTPARNSIGLYLPHTFAPMELARVEGFVDPAVQSRDLTAAYKSQFRARRRHRREDIHMLTWMRYKN